ncbi:putative membrane protein [Streptomonospora salina]|uniref:Putative membrane protein n=2 Tax=Streptomonospora salina TaxID=104205 RepID=A0A841E5E2_9ACTN|nr:PH domain-containing protein [Streptomonospora salina]MBB5996373.1 putative membrane protein [Streptomonospora salina]
MSAHAPVPGADTDSAPDSAPDSDFGSGSGWRRLSPLTVWAWALGLGAVAVPGSAAGTVLVRLGGGSWLWVALIVLGAAAGTALPTAVAALRWSRTRYRISGRRLEIRTGVAAVSYRSVPRERIRSVDVAVPLWMRPLGLCALSIGTAEQAGSGGAQIRLSAVRRDEGERLRARLLLRDPADPAQAPAGSAGDGRSGAGTARELVRLRPVWLGYAPVSAAAPALGAAAVGAAFNVLSLAGRDRADAAVAAVYGQVLDRPLLLLPGVAAALLVGAAAAAAVQAEAWWGYRVDREPDGTLRLQRGLVTTTSLSLEERRLRGVELRRALPQRWFGAARVRAVATGLAAEGGRGDPVPRNALSPDLPHRRALALSAAVVGESESPAAAPLRSHPRAALRRRVVRALAGTAVAAAAGAGLAPAAQWALAQTPAGMRALAEADTATALAAGASAGALAVGPPLAGWAVSAYRGLGHTVLPGYLVTRTGAFVRTTVALRREGIIGWRISRSPFQRRAGLATVTATTAAGPGRFSVPDVALGTGLRLADASVPGLLGRFLVRPAAERFTGVGAAGSGRGAVSAGPPNGR